MTPVGPASRPTRTAAPARTGPLRALQLIEPVGTKEPFTIVPVVQTYGTAVSRDDRMAEKVRWAERAEYIVLTRDIPASFAPFNAVIRVSEYGTEDRERDYLAQLVFEPEVSP